MPPTHYETRIPVNVNADLMKDAQYIDVRIDRCVPLFLARQTTLSGVKRLKAHILRVWQDIEGNVSGVVSGTGTIIVMPLQAGDEHLVEEYIQSQDPSAPVLTGSDIEMSELFAVVDGCHRISALMEIRQEHSEGWKDYMISCTCLRSRLPFERCMQLQRSQNQLLDEKYRIETTVFDLLKGLKDIYDRLNSCGSVHHRGSRPVEVKHQEVAEIYDGAPHPKRDSIRQAVSVAYRISKRALDAIGEVVREEKPTLCVPGDNHIHSAANSAEEVMQLVDCRVFRTFVTWSALRASATFMNATANGQEEAQVNTIHRLKSWCARNSFRTAQADIVTKQFHLALLAEKEDAKFLSFIEKDRWPSSMDSLRHDLHQTTRYDEELE